MHYETPFEDRSVLIVVAHPDDETLGAGGHLAQMNLRGILHVTNGAPRLSPNAREYARTRRQELSAALETAGIRVRRYELGHVDQEASLQLPLCARQVGALLDQIRPDVVLTHPYEGGHPDHDATAFAVHQAVRQFDGSIRVWEMASYHNRDGAMVAGRFLPPADSIVACRLSDEKQQRKRNMLACFATQRAMLCQFPVETEFFRPAPNYDFTVPPHNGKLFYEQFDWGMTGARWRDLARQAMNQFHQQETPRAT